MFNREGEPVAIFIAAGSPSLRIRVNYPVVGLNGAIFKSL
jgi:hypothetical protein